MDGDQLIRRFYPEANVGGFSHADGTISFFSQLVAIARPTDIVLDFGAGRGGRLIDDKVTYRRNIGIFKGRCAHTDGCDVDPVVLENPFLDDAKVIRNGERLPYEDNRFDIIVARHVFEHIEDPGFWAPELLRVLKPGGILAAMTPNKRGYIALSARLVPNSYHVRALSRIKPHRKAEDTFPTQYKLNTPADLRKAFGDGVDIFVLKKAAEPSYHFGRPWMFRLLKALNKHTPDAFLPALDVYIRKH